MALETHVCEARSLADEVLCSSVYWLREVEMRPYPSFLSTCSPGDFTLLPVCLL